MRYFGADNVSTTLQTTCMYCNGGMDEKYRIVPVKPVLTEIMQIL